MDVGAVASDITGIGSTALSGGIVGLVGSALKLGAGWLQHKQDMEKLSVDYAHELALYDKQKELAAAKTEDDLLVADEQLRTKSYDVYNDLTNVYKWAATAITLTRVVLLGVLWTLTVWVFYKITSSGIPYVDSAPLLKDIVNSVVFCAVTATTWWYGDRPPRKT